MNSFNVQKENKWKTFLKNTSKIAYHMRKSFYFFGITFLIFFLLFYLFGKLFNFPLQTVTNKSWEMTEYDFPQKYYTGNCVGLGFFPLVCSRNFYFQSIRKFVLSSDKFSMEQQKYIWMYWWWYVFYVEWKLRNNDHMEKVWIIAVGPSMECHQKNFPTGCETYSGLIPEGCIGRVNEIMRCEYFVVLCSLVFGFRTKRWWNFK